MMGKGSKRERKEETKEEKRAAKKARKAARKEARKEARRRSAREKLEEGAKRKRAAEVSDEDDDGVSADDDWGDSDELDEFIASDEEAEAEVEKMERLAAAGMAAAEEDEDDDEESGIQKLIRTRLGEKWIVADRSAPALEESGGAASSPAAKRKRDQLRMKHKREREKEAAAAAAGDGNSTAAGAGMGGSRIFHSLERSLSSFSVVGAEPSTLGAVPAPKRQASAPALNKQQSSNSLPGDAAAAMPAPTAFSAARLGGAFGAKAAPPAKAPAAPAAVEVPTGDAAAPAVPVEASRGPKPMLRMASFQGFDREKSSHLMARIGQETGNTAAKGFIFSRGAEKSRGGMAEGGDDEQQEKAMQSNPHSIGSSRSRPVVKGGGRTGNGAPSFGGGKRGASLLASVLSGVKGVGRAGKA